MNLLDLLQSASNSAASNVSAPVDALAWLLRKAGVPVPEDAVGGSQWMEQKGLTKPIKQSAESLAGETMGLIGPMAVAAKAPQVARGLLQMGENAAKPGLLNPQKGAIVWHGSPHKFDKFDSTKIGTGEGAQAYGHGLYLAESPALAKEYAEKLSSAGLARNTLAQNAGDMDQAISAAQASVQNYRTLLANGGGGDPRRAQGMLSLAEKKLADLVNMKAGTLDEAGNLYKVDLPDDAIAKMLDWDKPLSQQAPEVQKAFKGFPGAMSAGDAYRAKSYGVDPVGFNDAGQALFDGMAALRGRNPSAASDALRKSGIPGVRYLDGGSRGAGKGTNNYVVFPGEEGLLKIIERNGNALLNP